MSAFQLLASLSADTFSEKPTGIFMLLEVIVCAHNLSMLYFEATIVNSLSQLPDEPGWIYFYTWINFHLPLLPVSVVNYENES